MEVNRHNIPFDFTLRLPYTIKGCGNHLLQPFSNLIGFVMGFDCVNLLLVTSVHITSYFLCC